MSKRDLCSLPVLSILLAACGGGGDAAAPAVRDSAGVRIVENAGPAPAEWVMAAQPSVDIGGTAGDPLTDMGQIVGVVRLEDGRLVVANGQGPDVRYFDAAGAHLVTAGRRGAGPGEYQAMAGLLRVGGDSVVVADMMTRRMTVLSPAGATARDYTLGGRGGMDIEGTGPGVGSVSLAIPLGAFADGTVLGMVQAFRIGTAPAGAYRDSAAYVLFAPDGTAGDTALKLPGVEMEQSVLRFGGQEVFTPSPVPLGRITAVATGPDRIAVALNDRYEIEVHDAAGRLLTLIRVAQAPVPITEVDKAANRQEQLDALKSTPGIAGMPEVIMAQMRKRVEEATYPATYPYITELRFDPDGNLWAGEVQQAGTTVRRYAVFDPSGALIARVAMPDRYQPFWVGRDAVAGVWKDPDDVEHVRVYPLARRE